MLDCEIALSIFRKRQENIMLNIEMLLSEDLMFTIADNGLCFGEVAHQNEIKATDISLKRGYTLARVI